MPTPLLTPELKSRGPGGRGVPCLVTVRDLDEPDIEAGTLAEVAVCAGGHPTSRLTPHTETTAADMSDSDDQLDAEALLRHHIETGEPLDGNEVAAIVAAGLASADEFDQRGCGLRWHHVFPESPDLPCHSGAGGASSPGGADMSRPLDRCPACWQQALVAVCTVVAEYAIANDGDADQDWSQREVNGNSSQPESFRCGSCGAELRQFTLDERGHLVGLGAPHTEATLAADAMASEAFSEWLTARVDEWCSENGLTSGGEGCDLGDSYRDLEDSEAWAAIGVTRVPDYAEQVLYIVGPGASWVASTGIETGISGETLWHDSLGNLRLDVPMDELAVTHGGLAVDPPRWPICWPQLKRADAERETSLAPWITERHRGARDHGEVER